ncbi:MAG TPA: hypothetical protein VKM72_36475 [Thermoanaerobaculia bacterium]|nr:hypothetical protein [Thermoanaerobaculia bacterium]
MTTPSPAIFVAAMVRRTENKIVSELRSAGATAPDRATILEPWSPLARRRLERLKKAGALREAGAGRIYLDEPRWERHRRMKRTFALGVGGAATAVALLLWLLSGSEP